MLIFAKILFVVLLAHLIILQCFIVNVNLRYDNPLYAACIKQSSCTILKPNSLIKFTQGKDLVFKTLTLSSVSSLLVLHSPFFVFDYTRLMKSKAEGVLEMYPVGLVNSYAAVSFVGLTPNYFSFKRSQLTFSMEAESTVFNSPNVIYCGSHNSERQTDGILPCDHILERANALVLGQEGHVFKETFLFESPSPSRDPISLLRLLHNFILRRDLKLNQYKLQS